MVLLFEFSLPFQEPVLVFSLVLFIILLAPILLSKIKIPSIIGLIVAGVIVGPFGFNLLERNSAIELFGTVGLLYIMFLVGLELDLNEFKKSKFKSLFFGVTIFVLPISIGTLVCFYFLNLEFISSLLTASMFATYTLIAYPLVSRLGITKNEAVTVAVGGIIITDTLVLLLLALITGSQSGGLNHAYWVRLGLSIVVFSGIVFWGFPKVGRWFFKNVEGENTSQYIFVLAMVFFAAFLAEVAGMEAIIGAFTAGLALNRLIPHTSPLMNRIEFVGNALFIPFFLISVGMLVNLNVLLEGPEALIIAATLTSVALVSKWLTAFITQKVFRYSSVQRNVIFGLSSAHAAATLAVILVGYQLELVDENVLNGAIILIFVTCLISSFVTENAGRKLAIIESDKKPVITETIEKILVPISNPATIEHLMDLAIMLKNKDLNQPIYPLTVVRDDEEATEKVLVSNKMLEKATIHASATESKVQVLTRVDLNIASGIIRTMKELMITDVIIGWNEKVRATNKIFGTTLDNILHSTNQMIWVSKIVQPLNTSRSMAVVLPPNIEIEFGFIRLIDKIKLLARHTGAGIRFYCSPTSIPKLELQLNETKPSVEAKFNVFDAWEDFLVLLREVNKDDLIVIVSARKGTVSYTNHLDKVPAKLSRYFTENSFIVIYPTQNPAPNMESIIS
ncbi:cation:proton antiporter [Catalinimonas niigatensis]|uniref:cation:proton antiporter n=1 Tax=Catalinimonas niigatensis TaxID=1397264 RepID=UPI0026668EF2|nr:cation:proton antiporter [Catalinimonas niigatensis]WPP52573.1 cation:proton antiporter [Catalinimonas niigatensis]